MSGGGLYLQTQNHLLKGYFGLLRWMSPPPKPALVDHCKPLSELALSEKSGGPGAVPGGARLVPVVPHGTDRFIGSDDDDVARMVEGRFLNLQPHFCSHDFWKL
ncbi:hypothetical protein Hanom_Chr11g01001131 [Helianthus anomalus]